MRKGKKAALQKKICCFERGEVVGVDHRNKRGERSALGKTPSWKERTEEKLTFWETLPRERSIITKKELHQKKKSPEKELYFGDPWKGGVSIS